MCVVCVRAHARACEFVCVCVVVVFRHSLGWPAAHSLLGSLLCSSSAAVASQCPGMDRDVRMLLFF